MYNLCVLQYTKGGIINRYLLSKCILFFSLLLIAGLAVKALPGKFRLFELTCEFVNEWFRGYGQTTFIETSKGSLVSIEKVFYLKILNISNTLNTTTIGKIRSPYQIEDIYVKDPISLIADGWSGLHLIPVSEPENPTESDYYYRRNRTRGVFIISRGTYLPAFTS